VITILKKGADLLVRFQLMPQSRTDTAVVRPTAELVLDLGRGVSMKLVQIPAGRFLLGMCRKSLSGFQWRFGGFTLCPYLLGRATRQQPGGES